MGLELLKRCDEIWVMGFRFSEGMRVKWSWRQPRTSPSSISRNPLSGADIKSGRRTIPRLFFSRSMVCSITLSKKPILFLLMTLLQDRPDINALILKINPLGPADQIAFSVGLHIARLSIWIQRFVGRPQIKVILQIRESWRQINSSRISVVPVAQRLDHARTFLISPVASITSFTFRPQSLISLRTAAYFFILAPRGTQSRHPTAGRQSPSPPPSKPPAPAESCHPCRWPR